MSTPSDRTHAAEGRLSTSFLVLVYANAFITGAVVMGFEMLGSRYLNPFFGSGIYTWAALISTVLAALTAGYFFGGWMADRNPKPSGLGWLIVAGSAYLAVIPLFADGLLDLLSSMLGGLADQREFERWGSIAGAMLLLFVPLALLGVYSPYAIRLTLRATARSGTVAGRIYGISTLGSIFGTLFVTFYLIPTMGSRHITYLLSAIGVAAGLSFLVVKPGIARRALPALAAALALAVLAAPQPSQADPPRLELAQTTPDAKEAAERFIGYLRKQGLEVQHGAIETAPRGFRIRDIVFISRSTVEEGRLSAAALDIASFEDRPNGDVAAAGVIFDTVTISTKDGGRVTAARIAAETLAWSAKESIATTGLAARDIVVTEPKGDEVRVTSFEAALFRIGKVGGALERLAVRGISSKGKTESGTVAAIDIESVLVDVPSRASVKNVIVRDISASLPEGPVRIAAVELRAFEMMNLLDRNPGDLRALQFAIKGVEAPIGSGRDPKFAAEMKELGYTTLKMSAEVDYRYEEASKIFNLAKLEIDVADMAAYTFGLKVGGITPEEIKKALEPSPPPAQGQPPRPSQREGMAAMGIAARLTLISADLSLRDKSIIGRLIKREAQKKQTDEAAIRGQYRAMLQALRDAETDQLVRELYDTVIAFLENPGELIVEVRPPAPMNFLAIGTLAATSPAQLRTVLGIKITYKKP
jgi:MFS family permease